MDGSRYAVHRRVVLLAGHENSRPDYSRRLSGLGSRLGLSQNPHHCCALSSSSDVSSQPHPPSFEILGVRVHAVQMPEAVECVRSWMDAPEARTRFVAVTGMHGIAESRQSGYFRHVLNTADLVVPDGMPLVWVGRVQGHPLRHRVCGSELMDNLCRQTGSAYRHFFFGGT